jgi:hypothetical protein
MQLSVSGAAARDERGQTPLTFKLFCVTSPNLDRVGRRHGAATHAGTANTEVDKPWHTTHRACPAPARHVRPWPVRKFVGFWPNVIESSGSGFWKSTDEKIEIGGDRFLNPRILEPCFSLVLLRPLACSSYSIRAINFFFEHASVLFVNYSTGSLSPPTTPHSARPRNTVHFHTGRGREAETENRREVREDSSKEKKKTKERMAAVAATVTAALSSCSKRESDIVSLPSPSLLFFLLLLKSGRLLELSSNALLLLEEFCTRRRSWSLSLLLICYRPKKAEKGRSPPKEEVEAFIAAAENGLARRFATKWV